MVHNWITILNIFLFLIILVASLSIPGDMYGDAALIGEDDDRTDENALSGLFDKLMVLFQRLENVLMQQSSSIQHVSASDFNNSADGSAELFGVSSEYTFA